MAETSTALATRAVPCRPMYLAHLAAAGRMTDVDRVLEIERLDEFRQIVGVRVHVVALPGLAGAPVPASIMRDAAVAV